MYSEIFEDIGLSPNEAKIYEALVFSGESAVSLISLKSNVHRRNVYDALNRLVEKGLVFRIVQKGENRYQAVHPNKLMGVIKDQEKKLNKILPALTEAYESDPPEESAFIYKGLEGYKNYHNDVMRVKQPVYLLGAKGLWLSKDVGKKVHEDYIGALERNKIPFKMLFNSSVRKKLPEVLKYKYGEYKFLPEGYDAEGGIDIFGDYVVTFISVDVGKLDEDATLLVVKNKTIADSYKLWFKFIWERCPSIK